MTGLGHVVYADAKKHFFMGLCMMIDPRWDKEQDPEDGHCNVRCNSNLLVVACVRIELGKELYCPTILVKKEWTTGIQKTK